ncbi:sulfurase [Patescibacteria group bacterium]|nr:sulfurase [Patescibacteria group bacterium]
MKEGRVTLIFVSPDKGFPMQSVDEVEAIAGIGLAEDRYAEGKGAYSNSKRKTIRQVSLIELEAIGKANAEYWTAFSPQDTRRNILTSGIDLNSLVGKDFRVGEVKMRGVELCEPCDRPSKLSKKKGFNEAFQGRGGLRAEVLSSGTIYLSDLVEEVAST